MNGIANRVCPKCGGVGVYITTGGTICPMCNGAGIVDVFPSEMQGCNHFGVSSGTTSPVNGFPKSYVYDNKKTLLDEFAMALAGSFPYGAFGTFKEMSRVCYEFAAAMMLERAKRDEMGNIKEVME